MQASPPTEASAQASPPLPARAPGLVGEMRGLPWLDPKSLATPDLQVSLLIPARGAAHSLEETLKQAHAYLTRHFDRDFEVILIPNPSPFPKTGAPADRSIEVAEELARRYEQVRVCVHRFPPGKGAALRSGFAASRGRLIFFTDADLPYRLEFFEQAVHSIQAGFDLVTGNRRLDASVFDVPVHLLNLAYRRHRLGLSFNRAVRWLMPIETTDTQAGIKAMSRSLALEAFSRQRCPGFFFDLELFLTARGLKLKHAELPVTLLLNSEKSTVRVLREGLLAVFWLVRISLRDRLKKAYGPRSLRHLSPLKRYPAVSLGTRIFLEARWRLTPYAVMAAKLPPRGRILDLGCGHGLFALALAQESASRDVLGLDHDLERLKLARQAGQGLPNLRFTPGTLSDPEQTGQATGQTPVEGISIIDVMHYFGPEEQERVLRQAYDVLAPGGVILVREVDPSGGLMSRFNRLYEKLATGIGFTRSEKKQQLHFRERDEWEELMRRIGLEVTSENCSHPLFADVLFVGRKPMEPLR